MDGSRNNAELRKSTYKKVGAFFMVRMYLYEKIIAQKMESKLDIKGGVDYTKCKASLSSSGGDSI